MHGTLTVTDTLAEPADRPEIDVEIKSGNLSKVRRTRRLKVEVGAQTQSDNIALTAKKGRKTIAHKSNIDLGAAESSTFGMKLTRKGRRALKGLDSARIKLRGTVPFGAPETDRRRLT